MTESKLQQSCVNWFRYSYPHWRLFLVAIPNGGNRDAKTGALMKKEGAVAGAPDLLLFHPKAEKMPLMLECKLPKGKKSESQVHFERVYKQAGYDYQIFRSVDEFIELVDGYLF